jgi:hypothetical protein
MTTREQAAIRLHWDMARRRREAIERKRAESLRPLLAARDAGADATAALQEDVASPATLVAPAGGSGPSRSRRGS